MDFKKYFKKINSSTTPDLNKEQENNFNQSLFENNSFRYENETKRSGKKMFKKVISTVSAGVVGSALTLTVLPYTGYLKHMDNSVSNPQPVSAAAPVNTAAKPTVPNSSGSIANMVAKVSKTIVGIENYQQQNNSNDPFGNSRNSWYGGFGDSGGFGNSNGSSANSQPTDTGSGIIFKKDSNSAYIVTNNHVVEGGSKIVVSLYTGARVTATLVGTDALTDLAVLKIPSKYVTDTAQFGDSSTLRPGDQVYAIGNPLGLDLSRTVTAGIVSATNRTISEPTSAGNWDTTVIQTDAAINPGNSGGALINNQGLVMGINSAKISETGVEGLGFAIPSNSAIPIINQLIKNGKIVRPYLGVELEDLSQIPQIYWQNMPSNVTKGAMIINVNPHSDAASNGLQAKDVIVSINGTPITSSADLREYLYIKSKIGDTVDFGLYRNGKLMHIKVKLTDKTGAKI
jgi:serine protease Do